MSELEPQVTSDDPIASLHKMSTTAGVGGAEYVQINTLAVASLILGVASLLAFLGTPFLLLGIAGIICGVLGIRQIARSAGTQGGSALAWLGIVLSLLIAGGVGGNLILTDRAQAAERSDINATLEQLGRYVSAGQYKEAYALFDPEFQRRVSPEEFANRWRMIQDSTIAGRITGISGNNIVRFEMLGDFNSASTNAIVTFEKEQAPRITVQFRQHQGAWKLLYFELIHKEEPAP